MHKKIIKTRQHPNWKEGVLIYYEDGSRESFPKLEHINSSVKTEIKYLDLNGGELKTISDFGF